MLSDVTTLRLRGLANFRGFTLIELLVILLILGILAALVVPTFSTAAASARESNLIDNLRHIRTQLMVYAAQHEGIAPGYPNGDRNAAPTYEAFVAQMTGYSDKKGLTSATSDAAYNLGPYLIKIPANPFNDSAQVRVIGNNTTFPGVPSGTEGWFYQPSTLTFVANEIGEDKSGRAYFDY